MHLKVMIKGNRLGKGRSRLQEITDPTRRKPVKNPNKTQQTKSEINQQKTNTAAQGSTNRKPRVVNHIKENKPRQTKQKPNQNSNPFVQFLPLSHHSMPNELVDNLLCRELACAVFVQM